MCECFAKKEVWHGEYEIELYLNVDTYVLLFKGEKFLQFYLSRGLSVCVLCRFSIDMNSPTQSLSHVHRAPWEGADLREALAGEGGLDRAERVEDAPMGMALSLSGNHFVRQTTLILLVSLLPSVQRSRPVPRMGSSIAAGPITPVLLFEDRPHCTALWHLIEAGWEQNREKGESSNKRPPLLLLLLYHLGGGHNLRIGSLLQPEMTVRHLCSMLLHILNKLNNTLMCCLNL